MIAFLLNYALADVGPFSAVVQASTLLTGIVASWTLDEQTGNRADSVGSNTLVDNNSVGVEAGKVGNAAKLVAANLEYFSLADNNNISFGDEDFTISAWVLLETKAASGTIVSKWYTTTSNREYDLQYRQAVDRFAFVVSSDGAGAGSVTVEAADNLGSPAVQTWYFVVGWHDSVNNTLNIQVDDGTVDSAAYSAGVHDGVATLGIGALPQNAADYLDGRVDDVNIWGKVLTTAERTELYNGGRGNPYPFAGYKYTDSTLANFTAAALHMGSNPVVVVGTGAESDLYIREIGNVLYEPADTGKEYKTWYTGYNAGSSTDEKIHYAYSADGITWTKEATNPVIAARAEDPYVINVSGTYYIYVEDKVGGATDITRWDSADGITWANEATVLAPGAGGQWDDADVSSPVVWKEGATWYMLYEGRGTGDDGVGLATSADGATWAKDGGNPAFIYSDTSWVLSGEPIVPDDIVKDGSTYYLFYHGETASGDHQCGVATSANLTAWTDRATNPLETDSGFGRLYGVQYIAGASDRLYYTPGNDNGAGAGESDNTGIYLGYMSVGDY